jgi:hypothetical protein
MLGGIRYLSRGDAAAKNEFARHVRYDIFKQ